jgi:hypothetical protein
MHDLGELVRRPAGDQDVVALRREASAQGGAEAALGADADDDRRRLVRDRDHRHVSRSGELHAAGIRRRRSVRAIVSIARTHACAATLIDQSISSCK